MLNIKARCIKWNDEYRLIIPHSRKSEKLFAEFGYVKNKRCRYGYVLIDGRALPIQYNIDLKLTNSNNQLIVLDWR